MAADYTTRPPHHMRRHDRAMDDESQIREMLHRAPFGILATASEGQPFVNSNLFVYDEEAHAIYLHTAQEGRTRANVEANARVCFSVSEMGRLLPADEALEFSVEYAGVTVFGRATLVRSEAGKRRGLQLLLDKYFPHLEPGVHYRPITADELARTAVFRVQIEDWSGKAKRVAPDFPGAFRYGDPPEPA